MGGDGTTPLADGSRAEVSPLAYLELKVSGKRTEDRGNTFLPRIRCSTAA